MFIFKMWIVFQMKIYVTIPASNGIAKKIGIPSVFQNDICRMQSFKQNNQSTPLNNNWIKVNNESTFFAK